MKDSKKKLEDVNDFDIINCAKTDPYSPVNPAKWYIEQVRKRRAELRRKVVDWQNNKRG